MHAIVTTPGFVIDSRSYGEADKLYSIFTRDLGLIKAVAQGIRLEKSKLRYHVREHNLGMFSLVRGRDMWRLTNAQGYRSDIGSIEAHVGPGPVYGELLARVSLILRRILHGEEPNPTLFEHIKNCVEFLTTTDLISEDHMQTLESLTVARILHALGYVSQDEEIKGCISSLPFTRELLEQTTPQRLVVNKHINKAIKESHL